MPRRQPASRSTLGAGPKGATRLIQGPLHRILRVSQFGGTRASPHSPSRAPHWLAALKPLPAHVARHALEPSELLLHSSLLVGPHRSEKAGCIARLVQAACCQCHARPLPPSSPSHGCWLTRHQDGSAAPSSHRSRRRSRRACWWPTSPVLASCPITDCVVRARASPARIPANGKLHIFAVIHPPRQCALPQRMT